MAASLASGPSARSKGTHTVKDITDMNGVMGACVGIVDAISAGQDPEVKEEIRKRTVREVASFVRLFKKAGILVSLLDGRRREIKYDPMGAKVAAVMLRSKATITTPDDVAEIVKQGGSLHGLWSPLGYGIVVYLIDLPNSAQAARQQSRLALKA
jgi:hypothetical protein